MKSTYCTCAVWVGVAFALVVVASGPSSAFVAQNVETKRDAFRIGAGLQWDFGNMQPSFIASGRWTETRPNSGVVGGRVELAIPFTSDYRPLVRFLALAGNRDLQGEAGFAYRFAASDFLFGLGVQAPHVNVGINYAFASSFLPYAGLNTFGRAPASRTFGELSR